MCNLVLFFLRSAQHQNQKRSKPSHPDPAADDRRHVQSGGLPRQGRTRREAQRTGFHLVRRGISRDRQPPWTRLLLDLVWTTSNNPEPRREGSTEDDQRDQKDQAGWGKYASDQTLARLHRVEGPWTVADKDRGRHDTPTQRTVCPPVLTRTRKQGHTLCIIPLRISDPIRAKKSLHSHS